LKKGKRNTVYLQLNRTVQKDVLWFSEEQKIKSVITDYEPVVEKWCYINKYLTQDPWFSPWQAALGYGTGLPV
jgi:hypothetical protein